MFMRCALLAFGLLSVLGGLPDEYRTGPQLIMSKGYPFESHNITTDDGYILQLFRIPHGVKGITGAREPVILQHGVLDSADCWLLNLANESLAFIMADAGYDVWMGNSRGNKYSLGNTKLSYKKDPYWQFTWDNMAQYDVPAVVAHVLNMTGFDKVAWVGHSQGTTQMFANLATANWSVASKLKVFVALAPVTYVDHTKSLLIKGTSELGLEKLVDFLDPKSFLPTSKFFRWLLPGICKDAPALCDDLVYLLAGYDNRTLNQTRWPVYISHFPSGISTLDLCHWAQGARENKFQMYNFGYFSNEKHYGQHTPPQYNLSSISGVKMVLLYGGKDDLGDVTDVQHALKELPQDLTESVLYPDAAHLDFTWSPYVTTTIYAKVQEAIRQA